MKRFFKKRSILNDEKKLSHFLAKDNNLNICDKLLEDARKGNAKALRQIGNRHFNEGDSVSLTKAFQLYDAASDLSNSEAQYLLGRCYMNAWGIPQADHQLSCYMFSLAAICDHPESLYKIGFMFHYGIGVSQDYSKAKILYDKAVKHNIKQAEYNLGVIYECGLGVEEDLSIAALWYKKSKQNGFYLAKECLERIERKKGLFSCFKPKKKFTHNLDAIETIEHAKIISVQSILKSDPGYTMHDPRFVESKSLTDVDLVIMTLELANRNKASVNLNEKKMK